MLNLREVNKYSTKTIKISNGISDLFKLKIEFYNTDNILFPDFDLEYPYKFRATNHLLETNEIKYIKRNYRKILKIKTLPKKVETGELLLYFCNNNLQLLHKHDLIQPKFGCVTEEDNGNLLVSFIDNYYPHSRTRIKSDFTLIEEFNLNKIFNLTILVKVGSFNQIENLYYTTDCVIKNEILL